MKITTRTTYGFIELKVDEIETTIFKDSVDELKQHITNLEEVIEDLEIYLEEDETTNNK